MRTKDDGITKCQGCDGPFQMHTQKNYRLRNNVEGLKVCHSCKHRFLTKGTFERVKARIPSGSVCEDCGATRKLSHVKSHLYCSSCRGRVLSAMRQSRSKYLKSLSPDELLAIVRNQE